MKKSGWLTLAIIVVVILVAVAIIYFKNKPSGIDEQTAICIGQNSHLYVQLGCPHCKAQEELFGENLKYINVTDCWYDRAACEIAGINQIPAWFIDGQQYVGKKTIEELKTLAGC